MSKHLYKRAPDIKTCSNLSQYSPSGAAQATLCNAAILWRKSNTTPMVRPFTYVIITRLSLQSQQREKNTGRQFDI